MQTDPWIVLGDYIDHWGEATRVGLPMADLKVHTSVIKYLEKLIEDLEFSKTVRKKNYFDGSVYYG